MVRWRILRNIIRTNNSFSKYLIREDIRLFKNPTSRFLTSRSCVKWGWTEVALHWSCVSAKWSVTEPSGWAVWLHSPWCVIEPSGWAVWLLSPWSPVFDLESGLSNELSFALTATSQEDFDVRGLDQRLTYLMTRDWHCLSGENSWLQPLYAPCLMAWNSCGMAASRGKKPPFTLS